MMNLLKWHKRKHINQPFLVIVQQFPKEVHEQVLKTHQARQDKLSWKEGHLKILSGNLPCSWEQEQERKGKGETPNT